MLSNIAIIVRNISLIIYYKTTDISNTFVEYMREWIVDGRVEYETIDEPRYISQDYEDRVEESLNRNRWGFPTK
jgi:signal transduction protein with GAF and PtsI domain|tara:strand:+ start:806 stop:1027 length:222 start_codon:yes stop_codon:yes gene_type:complete